MATIYKRARRWKAVVRRTGHPTMVKSFVTKADAAAWARECESRLDRGLTDNMVLASRTYMRDLFDRYGKETASVKRNASREVHTLSLLKKHFGSYSLAQLKPSIIKEFRDARLAEGRAPATVNRNLSLLSAVVRTAMTEWDIFIPYNPVLRVPKLKGEKARDRRLVGDEAERLLKAAKDSDNPEIYALICLAIETAMRLGELLDLDWDNIHLDQRYAYLPMTKNGSDRKVPLSRGAIAFLEEIGWRGKTGKVFRRWKKSGHIKKTWGNVCKAAGIGGLRFHDLRHEAASRMAERGMDILKISAVTGHKSLQMLKRYTHFKTEDLADMLDKPHKSGKMS